MTTKKTTRREYLRRCIVCKSRKLLSLFPGNLQTCADCKAEEQRKARASSSYALYDGAELRPFTGRPGAMDAFALPSRAMGRRKWRDGREEPAA